MPPHAQSIEGVLTSLGSGRSGLSDEEAAERLRRVGLNRLPKSHPVSALRIFTDQLRSFMVVLLIAAAAISFSLGERIEAMAIAVVLAINTAIGFATELRARRAMAALLQLDVPRAVVVRSGQSRGIDAHTLVPGDVIVLDAGQHVPADGRLIHVTDLRTDEAQLTGESLPVSKSAGELALDLPLGDRTNMVYNGTTVAAGTARAVVTHTGAGTELGKIGTLTSAVREEQTPLERRLDELGRRLVWLALTVAGIVALLGWVQGVPLALVIEMGIALAVAAVPEALPAVATIALAVGVRRMAQRQALVRRLPAVESLGSTTVICTDKTRTLTSGEMTVVRIWTDGQEFDLSRPEALSNGRLLRALEVAALASRIQASHSGPGAKPNHDPVDAAILRAAERLGIDRARVEHERPAVGLVPFSSERKLMASFHRVNGVTVAYAKGAPRQILALTGRANEDRARDDGASVAMEVNDRFARAGLRVLALASGVVPSPEESSLAGLEFIGFIGFMDPPAAGVRETIARLRSAGLRTVMLTGDQRLTAEAIGRDLGVLTGDARLVSAQDLDAMSPDQLSAAVATAGAFSRISPEHKLAIVSAMQRRGEIVAMIGDGVNDAAAIKKADVGVAMGRRGTDVAKEAASIVLQDDRFETIAAAVEEGRVIFDNIRKFVFYLFSCNVAEVLVLLGAGIAGLPLPLLPLQLLWLNIVTDTFPALALAMEPGDSNVMSRPPREPQEAILSWPFLTSIILWGLVITASTLSAFVWCLYSAPDAAVTVAFMTLAFAQVFHLGSARGPEPMLTPSRIAANPWALGAVALSVGLQLGAVWIGPLARTLRLVSLRGDQWAVIALCSALPAVFGQGAKLFGSNVAIVRATSP